MKQKKPDAETLAKAERARKELAATIELEQALVKRHKETKAAANPQKGYQGLNLRPVIKRTHKALVSPVIPEVQEPLPVVEEERKKPYIPLPTMLRFHQSTGQVRAIIGSVGCYSGDTEFLTPTGWVRFDRYDGTQLVGQWDERSKELDFVYPDRFIKEPCDEFIWFQNEHAVSMVLSPEHKMGLYDYKGRFVSRRAEDVEEAPSRYTVPISFVPTNNDYPISDAKLRVMVAFHADGNIQKAKCKNQVVTLRKWRKKARLEYLLDAADIEYVTAKSDKRPTEVRYRFTPPILTKHYDAEWCWKLSRRQLEIVVDEMQHWDGLYEGPDSRFTSIVKADADFIQYAVHAIGGRATISVEKQDNPKHSDLYVVHIALPGSYKATAMLRGDTCSVTRMGSPDGFKYCFTVPSGWIVVRHNGRIFISGNSGKTSAATLEICYYLPMMLAKEYGIMTSRWVVVRNCFDDETEILTEFRGWQLFKDLLPADRVASLEGDELRFVQPTFYYKADYVGQMIGFESEGVDFRVTPDHNLYVSSRNARKKEWSPYQFRKAHECFGKQLLRVKRNAGSWKAEISPDEFFNTEARFEWLGYWFAEGSTNIKAYNGSVRHNCIVTTKNDVEYADDIFQRAGLPYTKGQRSVNDKTCAFRLRVTEETKAIIKELHDCGKATTKRIPAKWKNAPRSFLQAFIKGYLQGDGSHRTKDVTICAVTSSSGLADDIQEIALKAGYVVNLNVQPIRERMVINGVETKQNAASTIITFVRPIKYRPGIISNAAGKRYRGWYRETYSGQIYCVEVPSHVVYVRRKGKAFWCSQSYRELADTTLKTVMQWFPDGKFKASDNTYKLTHPGGIEAEYLFRACDRPDDVKKFKSLEITGYWIDEANEVDGEIKRMLKNRIGRYPDWDTWVKALQTHRKECAGLDKKAITRLVEKNPHTYLIKFGVETSNPPDVEHEMYQEFAWDTPPPGPVPEGQPKEHHVGFWQPPGENSFNLTPNYYADLRHDYRDNPDWIEIYIEGKPGIIAKGKLVYYGFRRDIHMAKAPLIWSGGPLFRGWDNSGNVPAAVVAQVPRPKHIQVLKEFTSDKMVIGDFARWVVMTCNTLYPGATFTDWGDPAGENKYSTREGTFTSNKQLIYEATGANVQASEQNLTARISSVETALRMIDGILIDPGCHRLINGFLGGYHYKEIGQAGSQIYTDKPEKNRFSHCFRGDVLVATTKGQKPIEDIRIGDFVLTPIGPRPVSAVMSSIADNIVKTSFSNGARTICTPDHRYAFMGRFSPIDALQYGDVLLAINNFKEEQLWEGPQSMTFRNSTERSIITNLGQVITNHVGLLAELTCTGMFGSSITALSLMGQCFTTKMGIAQTTPFPISVFFQPMENTLHFTAPSVTAEILMPLSRALFSKGLPPQFTGIKILQTARGMSRSLKRDGLAGTPKSIPASFAVNYTAYCAEQGSADSALLPASPKPEEEVASITKREYVSSAQAHLWRVNTPSKKLAHADAVVSLQGVGERIRIESKERIRATERVYDLTVDEAHCFFADGLLVSNCQDALQYVMVKLVLSAATGSLSGFRPRR